MKFKNTLSKVIIIYWIVVLTMAGGFSIESFFDLFRGTEEFSYRIILRLFTLTGILYLLGKLFSGLSKQAAYSIPVLSIIFRFSYLTGILGLTAIIMHISNLARSSDAYLFGGVCCILGLSAYLSNMWFKRNYQTMQLEE